MFPLLSDALVFSLMVRLVLGAFASFLAIVAWTRTRDLAWVLVIAGILASYAGTLYGALRSFGLFAGADLQVLGVPLGSLISDNLSVFFFIFALFFHIKANK